MIMPLNGIPKKGIRNESTKLLVGVLAMFTTYAARSAPNEANPAMEEFLKPTRYLTVESTPIRQAVEPFRAISDPSARAVAIHDWVRDQIAFGFSSDFWRQTADEVLKSRVGYCNTKSTLFVTMLRATGIPARQVFVSIRGDILRGIVDAGSYVDHSYTELFLEGRWIRTDSYIVDQPLFDAASRQLALEKQSIGYGIVLDGTTHFNGSQDSFSQFKNDGTLPALSDANYGVFEDVGDFYRRGENVRNGGWFTALIFRLFAGSFTRRVAALRSLPLSGP